ncbi:hypothetical protein [Marinomonas posidonica]|uniref:Uncharacterized protein n=1 Tax=Marinomonas posidonica (strain CECT 7376 / NCIMB 14433 / IVIA-Po-181) TaxID=491952 RepID=F6CUQ7_MARPP|nr:hypothetical protein [Marinomonas posidonica]AEF54167.1 hypothetical protein Mar181_1119 [Marinomonas posidonica IVIA-Po-181]
MRSRVALAGGILFELLIACAVLSLCLPFMMSALRDIQGEQFKRQVYQQGQSLQSAIDAHFRSQWQRLLPAQCQLNSEASLTIQSSAKPPKRLSARSLLAGSDWLLARDYGLCRASIEVTENPLTVALACHWKSGDQVRFSSCNGSFLGQVMAVSSQGAKVTFDTDQVLGQSGVIASEDSFYWYLAEGKTGQGALWRSPEVSGNALELWNGIERLSIFPLLDQDQNGFVDTLDTRYGHYALQHVRALWVEYQFRLGDCQVDQEKEAPQRYLSMRGEEWQYQRPCQQVGNQIIDLQGRSW